MKKNRNRTTEVVIEKLPPNQPLARGRSRKPAGTVGTISDILPPVMSAIAVKQHQVNIFYTPHEAQKSFHHDKARFRIVVAGRQFGKTMMIANELVRSMWGQAGQTAWWCSFRYRITQVGFNYIRKQFKLIIKESSRAKMRIEFKNGSVIEFRSTKTWEELVGEPLNYLVVDESGQIPELAITESLLPTLTVTRGKAIFCGTPKGKNWFHRFYKYGLDIAKPEYASFHYTSYDNPYADIKFINDRKKDTPERTFKQEYLAEFLDQVGTVFTHIEQCLSDKVKLLASPKHGDIYTMGLDLARLVDYTVISILNQNGELVYIERIQHEDWPEQVSHIAEVALLWNCTVYADSTGVGDSVVQFLARTKTQVETINFGGGRKRELIDNLVLGMQLKEITIPDVAETELVVEELRTYEYDINEKTGNVSFSAPSGKHDDAVISIALSFWGISNKRILRVKDIRCIQPVHDYRGAAQSSLFLNSF